jgi:hypothetical protein
MGWRGIVYRQASPLLPAVARDMIELRLSPGSGIVERGWPQSRKRGVPVDRDLNPLPWYTYPAIRFLERRVKPSTEVFEYGMGYSTLWWAKRVAHVTSCEHDQEWVARLRPSLPSNVTPQLRPVYSPEYVNAAADADKPIDILVIDGRRRVECASSGLGRLSQEGCVVWDNSDRSRYEPGFRRLEASGFTGRLDFWGMGPINIYEWCTSVFYRPGNCLGL